MKPASFEYFSARSQDEVLELLGHLGEDAKVLAGGQSLVPMMNFRLAQPTALVDLAEVPDLNGMETADGWVEVGACVRHADLERTPLEGPLGRLVRETTRHVGHLPIRMRGTIGGSVAHADPAAEWCILATALDAEMRIVHREGTRFVSAESFFDGYFTTALRPDELLTGVRFPVLSPESRVGFQEFARRAGDFALVAAVTVLEMERGRIARARIGLGGVADRAVRAVGAERLLVGELPAQDLFLAAAVAAAAEVDPPDDIQGPSDYRRGLVRALVRRSLAQPPTAIGSSGDR